VVARKVHGDRVVGHGRLVVGVRDDRVVKAGAPSTLSGVNVGRASDSELGGGRVHVLDGCYGVDTLSS
jgi:hypothetical protein